MRRRLLIPLAASLALASSLAACSSEEGAGAEAGEKELTVLAAASLTETFTALGEEFEKTHDGVDVTFAFDSSATLAAQAVEGAPADVLATADLRTMDDAVAGGAIDGDPQTFATNVMTLVVPADNPAGISSFADLDKPGVDYVLCVETAPCGVVGAALIADGGITADPASLEVDVKAVLAKVASGEADAGLVYVTDATAAGADVVSIEIPGAETQLLEYPIGVLEQTGDDDLAAEFIELVLSDEGRRVLADAGFGAP
ncbi:molybdate ABC transporter substrate-binding protein [Nocardioides sp. R-C-SC26]|uniref:molybdate ABC transporter substrate-binding protein n=1 Tax=Nocardioides sp. R-C-SC26 TaxID=2870414 RepID=UPI001E502758|nr:molybdate ABC transporter substrate-binding protein [Nocardioides sp. R-C-SC26]